MFAYCCSPGFHQDKTEAEQHTNDAAYQLLHLQQYFCCTVVAYIAPGEMQNELYGRSQFLFAHVYRRGSKVLKREVGKIRSLFAKFLHFFGDVIQY